MYDLDDDFFDDFFLPNHGGPAPPWQANRLHALGDAARPALFAPALDAYYREQLVTLKQLAEYLGISTSTLASWRKGKLPRASERERVAELLSKPYVPPATPSPPSAPAAEPVAAVPTRSGPQADGEIDEARSVLQTGGEINEAVAGLLLAILDRLPPGRSITLDEMESYVRRIRQALES